MAPGHFKKLSRRERNDLLADKNTPDLRKWENLPYPVIRDVWDASIEIYLFAQDYNLPCVEINGRYYVGR